ncbi:hypothetical protein [Nonomuraea sp. NPDC050540]|uniref:hypothetical protein n=1 Tax=Nonomuraea sp. NPDC050540 TaxID=3364367 RepID=UPI0037918DBD
MSAVGDPVTLLIVLAAVMTVTKTGRGMVGNAVRSGYKATGWRTPGKALIHHSGRAGAWTGRVTAKTAHAGRAGVLRRLKARWERRKQANPEPTPLFSRRPRDPDPPPLDPTPPQDKPKPAPGTAPAPETEPPASATSEQATPPQLQHQPAPTEASPQPPAPPEPTTSSGGSMSNPRRVVLDLDEPKSDAEFLDDCHAIASFLRSSALAISEWAEVVARRKLPKHITQPLIGIGEGLTEAANSAMTAATRFEEEFEEARDVAAAGMTITGRDAA